VSFSSLALPMILTFSSVAQAAAAKNPELAEFIAEINRVDRNMMNIYYKAKLCKQFIEENWMDRDKNSKKYLKTARLSRLSAINLNRKIQSPIWWSLTALMKIPFTSMTRLARKQEEK